MPRSSSSSAARILARLVGAETVIGIGHPLHPPVEVILDVDLPRQRVGRVMDGDDDIGDREADIFELFAQPRAPQSELLIRAEYNRKVKHDWGYLLPAIEQAPVLGQTTLRLERNPKRPSRDAQLTVKGMQVTLEVPYRKDA